MQSTLLKHESLSLLTPPPSYQLVSFQTFATHFKQPADMFRWANILSTFMGFELFIGVLAFLICRQFKLSKSNQRLPLLWPVFGMLPSVIINSHRIYDWFTETLLEYEGSFWFCGPVFTDIRALVTCKPENIEYILRTRFDNFPKGKDLHSRLHDLLGEGIFNVDDEQWQLQRKKASLEFHSPRSRKFIDETVERLVEEKLIPILEHASKNQASIDLQDVFLRYTFDNVCINVLGVDPGCLSINLPEIPFAKAFETAVEVITLRFILPQCLWKFLRIFRLGKERQLYEALIVVNQFAAEAISTRRKKMAMELETRADLLSCFLQLEPPCNDNFLRDVTINIILAGRDTSAVALSWFFWRLDKNPHVEEKILQEIHAVVRSTNKKITKEQLQHMHYLHAALSETLRLHPSVPIDMKQVLKDDTLPDGTMVRAGDAVLFSIYTMGRMKAIWGEDCLSFKPERWLKDGRFISESPFRYTAFNGGPRLCLGKEMAYMQMKAAAAAILQQFEVRVVTGQIIAPKTSLVHFMRNGLQVMLRPREGRSPSTYSI